VLIDYLAFPESEAVVAGTDAAECRWVEIERVNELDVTDGLSDMIRRGLALARRES
jgi:hypothetical protein